MVKQRTIVVIGGAHAGLTAASTARQCDEHARIILLEKSNHVAWLQADLTHYLTGDLTLFEKALKDRDNYFKDRYQLEVRLNTKVSELDMDARCVVAQTPNGAERIRFDAVIFAGGAINEPCQIPELEGELVSYYRNAADVKKIRQAIALGAKKAVVIGCGQFGMEAVVSLWQAGLQVEVIEKAPQIMPRFSLQASRGMQSDLEEKGICIHLSDQVEKAFSLKEKGFQLVLKSGKTLDADLVVITMGSRPCTEILAEAGAGLQKDGTLRVDSHMATTLPNVYACGSAIAVPQVLTNERKWLPYLSINHRTAQVAAYNASEAFEVKETFYPVAGTYLLPVMDRWYARTGLTLGEARKIWGENQVLSVTAHGKSSALWHDGDAISVSMLVNRGSQTVIGAEVWGKSGIARRIDILAMAVLNEFSPEQLVNTDMSYAPSLGPAFDPLKEAALLAKLELREQSKQISSDKLALWLAENKPFTWIDVSKPTAPAWGESKGIFSLPLENLREKLHEIDKRYPIIVSSGSGRRSFIAQRVLQQKGFEEVYYLDGGAKTWQLLMGVGK